LKISVKINVYNEAHNIAAACESVAWADELVICDSASTDDTIAIARRYTDKIYQREFRGYKDKHEYSDSMTTGDWIFWLDADERVTPELRAAIEALRQRDPVSLPDGFRIARRTRFLGRWILHSGWYPDYQMRLYRKAASYWDGVAPHETARVRGRVETLSGELLHYTSDSLSDHHRRMDSYTTLAAEYWHKQGKRVRGFDIFLATGAAFVRTYLFKRGFLDGVPGLIIALSTAYSVALKYAKIWERNLHNQKEAE
jgi:glycosyltransferase involved in cell wall biosynthesis